MADNDINAEIEPKDEPEPVPIEVAWFGSNLRRLRQDSGLTLRDFAADAGMSYSFLSRVEQGKSDIRMGNAIKLAHLLRASITEMLSRPRPIRKRIFRPRTQAAIRRRPRETSSP